MRRRRAWQRRRWGEDEGMLAVVAERRVSARRRRAWRRWRQGRGGGRVGVCDSKEGEEEEGYLHKIETKTSIKNNISTFDSIGSNSPKIHPMSEQ